MKTKHIVILFAFALLFLIGMKAMSGLFYAQQRAEQDKQWMEFSNCVKDSPSDAVCDSCRQIYLKDWE